MKTLLTNAKVIDPVAETISDGEVMFEDGRQGRIEADLHIHDATVSPERTRAAA